MKEFNLKVKVDEEGVIFEGTFDDAEENNFTGAMFIGDDGLAGLIKWLQECSNEEL